MNGYLAIVFGTGLTILVQSSSVLTSTLMPLVGLEAITIERMFALTVGANIGTTITAIIGAFAVDDDAMATVLQLAICHLYFNLISALIWYPIPALRKIPINMGKKFGEITHKYRYFPPLYLLSVFLVLPVLVLGLTYGGGSELCLGILGPLLAITLIILLVNYLQRKKPSYLPKILRNYDWILPPRKTNSANSGESAEGHQTNPAYNEDDKVYQTI